jgi:predicted nuclease of predicted toxin-antitoxin system
LDRPKLYLDEDVYHAVALGLRRRGYDVVTTAEAGRRGAGDEDQLRYAAAQGRVVVTFNRGDFARLHGGFMASGTQHSGVIVSTQAAIGPVVRALARVLAVDATGFANRLVWLQVEGPKQGR